MYNKKLALFADILCWLGAIVVVLGKIFNNDLIWPGTYVVAIGLAIGIWNLVVFLKNR
jgi:hypothetical protein